MTRIAKSSVPLLAWIALGSIPLSSQAAILDDESVIIESSSVSTCTDDATITWHLSIGEAQSSDVTFDYTVRIGGDGSSTDSGTQCTGNNCSGEVTLVANDTESGSVTSVVPVSDLTSGDGDYTVYVIAQNQSDSSDLDADAITVTLDCPPSAPSGLSVAIGDGRLFLSWSDPNTDTAQANIFYDTTSHPDSTDGSDYASSQTSSGSAESATVSSLTNGTRYYFRVSVTDGGSQTSGVSNEASGVPEEVVGLAPLNNELGGCGRLFPGSDRGTSLFLLGIIGVWLSIARRFRKRSIWMLLIPLLFVGVTEAREESPRRFTLEISVGPYLPDQITNYTLVYGGKHHPQYRFGLGWQFFQKGGTLELQGLLGYFQHEGRGITKTTQQRSGERFTFRSIPAQLSLVYRADFLKRFYVVPFAYAGGDYLYWREDQSGGSQDNEGTVKGYHYGGGVEIPLGWLEPRHDRYLDVDWGINEVSLFGKYEVSKIDDFGGGTSFDFSSETWLAGILFTF